MIISLWMPVARHLLQPTRKRRAGRPQMLPYLVLLQEGFAVPCVSPRKRWALTPPFHPYRLPGGLFSVALSSGSPPVRVTNLPALRSPDFPLAAVCCQRSCTHSHTDTTISRTGKSQGFSASCPFSILRFSCCLQPTALFFLCLGLVEHDAVTGGAENELVFLHQIIIQLRRDVHEAAPAHAAGHRHNRQAVAFVPDGGVFF